MNEEITITLKRTDLDRIFNALCHHECHTTFKSMELYNKGQIGNANAYGIQAEEIADTAQALRDLVRMEGPQEKV